MVGAQPTRRVFSQPFFSSCCSRLFMFVSNSCCLHLGFEIRLPSLASVCLTVFFLFIHSCVARCCTDIVRGMWECTGGNGRKRDVARIARLLIERPKWHDKRLTICTAHPSLIGRIRVSPIRAVLFARLLRRRSFCI